jgi:sterol 14-demethylase
MCHFFFFARNPIKFLQDCQKKYGDVFTFNMVGKRVTVCLGAEGNQFVFNSKQNMTSAAAAYNDMTQYVFGKDVVYDAPHSVFMEQKRLDIIHVYRNGGDNNRPSSIDLSKLV